MIQVSSAYRNAMTASVRDVGFVRITIGQFDNSGQATITPSREASYGDTSIITEDVTVTESYQTWTGNGLRGDARQRIFPESMFYPLGFVSADMSDEDGNFSESPFIIMEFTEQRTMIGLTLTFDDVAKEYPAQITCESYRNGTLLESVVSTDLAPVATPQLFIENADKVIVYFDKTREPYQNVVLNGLLFGIGYEYGNKDIIDMSVDENSDPLSLSIPKAKMIFKLKNLDRYFDPGVDNNRTEFFAGEQEVKCSVGQMLADGTVEWIPGGTWYLRTWDTKGINATFTAGTIIDRLTETSYETDVWAADSTIGDKLRAVIADSGISADRFTYPLDVDDILCPAPIAAVKHAEAIQLLANYGGYQLRIDRFGRLVMYRTVASHDFAFSTDALDTGYSDWANVGPDATEMYATWEKNFFRGDGSQRIIPDAAPYLNNGFVSQMIAADATDTVSIMATSVSGLSSTVNSVTLNFGGMPPAKASIYRNTGTLATPAWELAGTFAPTRNIERLGVAMEYVEQFRIDLLAPGGYPQRYRVADIDTSYVTSYMLGRGQIFHPIYTKQNSRYAQVRAKYYGYAVGDSAEIATATAAANGEVRITHEAATGITAAIDVGSVTVQSYAHLTVATVSGLAAGSEAKITLTGNPVIASEYEAVRTLNPTGDTLELKNPLYTGETIGMVMDWAQLYATQLVEQTIALRNEPCVEVGDYIMLEDGSVGIVSKRQYKKARDKFTVRRGEYSAVASA